MGLTLYPWTSFAFRPPVTYAIGFYVARNNALCWFIQDIELDSRYITTHDFDLWLDKCIELGILKQVPNYVFEMMSGE